MTFLGLNTKPLAGQLAVITGSTGGIGQALARHLSAAGADLILHTHRQKAIAERLADDLSKGGQRVAVQASDLSDPAARRELVEASWQQHSGVQIWINNAGVDVLTGSMRDLPFAEKLACLWDVDVMATIELSRLVGARMRDRREGSIVNIGWDQALVGMAGDSGEMFGAIKGAVMMFTLSLAKSLAPHVRVNCVAPGWIKTAWGEEASGYWQERACREALRGRWGTPDDVARMVTFLVSPAADFITGQILPVNGGYAGTDAAEPATRPSSFASEDDSSCN